MPMNTVETNTIRVEIVDEISSIIDDRFRRLNLNLLQGRNFELKERHLEPDIDIFITGVLYAGEQFRINTLTFEQSDSFEYPEISQLEAVRGELAEIAAAENICYSDSQTMDSYAFEASNCANDMEHTMDLEIAGALSADQGGDEESDND